MTGSENLLEVDINSIIPNPWNTNQVSPPNMDKLKNSIVKLGSFKPLIVRELDDKYEILGGEHRWLALKELGKSTVQVYNLGIIDDIKAKQISILDNERYGEDDAIGLDKLLQEIQQSLDYDLSTIAPFDITLDTAIMPKSEIEIPDEFADDLRALDDISKKESKEDEIVERETKSKADANPFQIMRFKVSIEDAPRIIRVIEKMVKEHGIKTGNEMENAGEALVYIIDEYYGEEE